MAADRRHEAAEDVADGGGEDVDAADDQHVVGAADAADAQAGAAARARRRPHQHVISCPEPQQGCRAMPEVRQDELAARAVLEADRPILENRASDDSDAASL